MYLVFVGDDFNMGINIEVPALKGDFLGVILLKVSLAKLFLRTPVYCVIILKVVVTVIPRQDTGYYVPVVGRKGYDS